MDKSETQSQNTEQGQMESSPRSLLPFVAIPHDGSDDAIRRELCPFMVQERDGWLTVAYVLGDVPELNAKKNAWLFAAAPELLAGLKHMRLCASCAEGSWEDCEGGRAALDAITKAEGAPSVPNVTDSSTASY